MRVFGFIFVLSALLALACEASNYNNSVPTPKEVLGYEIGTRVTNLCPPIETMPVSRQPKRHRPPPWA